MDQSNHRNRESTEFNYPEYNQDQTSKLGEQQQEQLGTHNIEEQSMSKAIERGVIKQGQQTQPIPFSTNPIINFPQDHPSPQNTQATPPITSGLSASDTDLIEKEWVVKAKAIIERTKDDPRQQSNELNKIKADYQKKRYNRDMKLNVE